MRTRKPVRNVSQGIYKVVKDLWDGFNWDYGIGLRVPTPMNFTIPSGENLVVSYIYPDQTGQNIVEFSPVGRPDLKLYAYEDVFNQWLNDWSVTPTNASLINAGGSPSLLDPANLMRAMLPAINEDVIFLTDYLSSSGNQVKAGDRGYVIDYTASGVIVRMDGNLTFDVVIPDELLGQTLQWATANAEPTYQDVFADFGARKKTTRFQAGDTFIANVNLGEILLESPIKQLPKGTQITIDNVYPDGQLSIFARDPNPVVAMMGNNSFTIDSDTWSGLVLDGAVSPVRSIRSQVIETVMDGVATYLYKTLEAAVSDSKLTSDLHNWSLPKGITGKVIAQTKYFDPVVEWDTSLLEDAPATAYSVIQEPSDIEQGYFAYRKRMARNPQSMGRKKPVRQPNRYGRKR